MDDKIYELLQEIPNVYEGWYRKEIQKTHVTFLEYNLTPDAFEDDDYSELNVAYQFDVWGKNKDEVKETDKKIKKILKENGFLWIDRKKDFEIETEIYHYGNRFIISISKEDEE